jgi:beta-lactamase regulating signal transducer with metallopeptidase domain
MTSAINLHAVAQFSAERMLNCIVEGMAIALFAWLLLRVIAWPDSGRRHSGRQNSGRQNSGRQNSGRQNSGRQNSGTRFAVWFVALVAIGALPFVGGPAPGGATAAVRPAITVASSWATYLFAMWAVIATLGLLRVGAGLWQVRRVRANCVEIATANLDPLLQVSLRQYRSSRSVKICVSDGLQVPTAIGFIKPVVALPAWALGELSATELNAILLHELAHLRRWDDWTNLAQKLLRAVFFFHPAVWWIESKLSLEREMACDDAVLAETANPRAYAECLVGLAEKSLMRRGLAMAQAAVSRVRQTSQRVAQILDAKRPGATRIWKPALGMIAAFAMICAGLLSRSPELVSFQDKRPTAEAASAAIAVTGPRADLKFMAAAVQPAKLAGLKLSSQTENAHPTKTVIAKAAPRHREVEQATIAADDTTELSQPNAVPVPVNFIVPDKTGENEPSTSQQQPRFKSVVLVYQGLEYDDAGFAHWTVCIWRVTVPAQQQSITTNPPKST